MSRGTEQVRARVMLGPVGLWSPGCNQTPVKQLRADQRENGRQGAGEKQAQSGSLRVSAGGGTRLRPVTLILSSQFSEIHPLCIPPTDCSHLSLLKQRLSSRPALGPGIQRARTLPSKPPPCHPTLLHCHSAHQLPNTEVPPGG